MASSSRTRWNGSMTAEHTADPGDPTLVFANFVSGLTVGLQAADVLAHWAPRKADASSDVLLTPVALSVDFQRYAAGLLAMPGGMSRSRCAACAPPGREPGDFLGRVHEVGGANSSQWDVHEVDGEEGGRCAHADTSGVPQSLRV